MNLIARALFLIAAIAAIGFALWISITLIGFFLLAGGALILFYAIRQFLLNKGILNPNPGVPMDESAASPHSEKITVIDTEFTRVDEKLPPQ
jgi:hypothetical protein